MKTKKLSSELKHAQFLANLAALIIRDNRIYTSTEFSLGMKRGFEIAARHLARCSKNSQ
jgi:hypothetical protein